MVDVALIAAAKRSPAYRLIRPRMANTCPSDGWYEEGCAFVVFDLTLSSEGANDGRRWVAHVVFAVARHGGCAGRARRGGGGDGG